MSPADIDSIKKAAHLLSRESPNCMGLVTYTRTQRQILREAFVALRNEVEALQVSRLMMPGSGETELAEWKAFNDNVLFSKEKEAGQSSTVRP